MNNNRTKKLKIFFILLVSIIAVTGLITIISNAKYVFKDAMTIFHIDELGDISDDPPTIEITEEDKVYDLTNEEHYTNEDFQVYYEDDKGIASALYWYNPDEKDFPGEGTPFDIDEVFTEEGWYKFVVTDVSGNTNTVIVLLDKTAPTITATTDNVAADYEDIRTTSSSSENYNFTIWFNTDATISEYDKFGITYTAYAIDVSSQYFSEDVSLSNTINNLAAGSHSNVYSYSTNSYYIIRAVDLCGNESDLIIGVDKVAPEIGGVPSSGSTNESVTIDLSDNLSGVKQSKVAYNATSNNFTNSTYTIFYTNTNFYEDGYYNVISEDVAGNVSSDTFMIDMTPPEIKGIDNNGVSSTSVTITFSDNLSGIKSAKYYTSSSTDFSSATAKTLTNNTTFTDEKYYYIVVTDYCGNVSTLTFLIATGDDTVPPEIALDIIETDLVNPSTSKVVAYKTLSGYKVTYQAYDSYSGVAEVKLYVNGSLYADEKFTDEVTYKTNDYYFDFEDVAFYSTAYIKVYDYYGNEKTSSSTVINDDQIWNATDMKKLASVVNSGTSFSGKTIYLMQDVNLNSLSFTPIGTSSKPFKGTFEANGYKISNLYVSTSSDYAGLFGYITNATINNLIVSGTVTSTGNYVGGIVGYNNGGTLNYNISQVTVSGSNYVGGITGYNMGILEYVFNTGKVTGTNYIGGIAGQNGKTGNTSSKIIEAINFGKVTGVQYVGGIVGINYVTLYETANKNTVTGTTHIGGIVGYNFGSITTAYNIGAISTSSSSAKAVGGLAGYNDGGTLKSCYSTGSVGSGASYIASGVGYNTGSLTYCFTVKTAGDLYGYNTGTVSNSCVVSTWQLKAGTGSSTFAEIKAGTSFIANGAILGKRIGLTDFSDDNNNLNTNGTYAFNFENIIAEGVLNEMSLQSVTIRYTKSNYNNITIDNTSNSSTNVGISLTQEEVASLQSTFEAMLVSSSVAEEVTTEENIEVTAEEATSEQTTEIMSISNENLLTVSATADYTSVDMTKNTISKSGSIYTRTYTNIFPTRKAVQVTVSDDRLGVQGYYYYSTTSSFTNSTRISFGDETTKTFMDEGYYKIEAYDTSSNKAVYEYFLIDSDLTDTVAPSATLEVSSPSSTSSPSATYTLTATATDDYSGIKSVKLYLCNESDPGKTSTDYTLYKTWTQGSWFVTNPGSSTVTVEVSECPFYGTAYLEVTDYYGNTTTTTPVYINTSLIYSATDLKMFSTMSNSATYYSKVQKSTIYLVNNINLSSVCSSSKGSWTPIGRSYSFQGTFNGNYYTISNLYVSTSSDYVGLFGYIINATIKCFQLTGSVTSSSGYSVGSAVGAAENSYIQYIKNSASVKVTGNPGKGVYVGGIVGNNEGNGSQFTSLSYLWNTGSVTVTNNTVGGYAGGIVGYSRKNVSYVVNWGSVSVTSSCDQPVCPGGIAGALWDDVVYNNVTLTYAYNLGTIYTNKSRDLEQVTDDYDIVGGCVSGIIGGAGGGGRSPNASGFTTTILGQVYNAGTVSAGSGNINQIAPYSASVSSYTCFYISGTSNYSGTGTAVDSSSITTTSSSDNVVYKNSTSAWRLPTSTYKNYPYLSWMATFTTNVNATSTVGASVASLTALISMDEPMIINDEEYEEIEEETEEVDQDTIPSDDPPEKIEETEETTEEVTEETTEEETTEETENTEVVETEEITEEDTEENTEEIEETTEEPLQEEIIEETEVEETVEESKLQEETSTEE